MPSQRARLSATLKVNACCPLQSVSYATPESRMFLHRFDRLSGFYLLVCTCCTVLWGVVTKRKRQR